MQILIAIIFLLFISCAQVNYPSFTSGSKSDGIVTLTYGYPSCKSSLSWIKGWKRIDEHASKRCQNWGFKDAIRFDKGKRMCIGVNAAGYCVYWQEDLNYQCIDYVKEKIISEETQVKAMKFNEESSTMDIQLYEEIDEICVPCPWPNGDATCVGELGPKYECTGLGSSRCCTLIDGKKY